MKNAVVFISFTIFALLATLLVALVLIDEPQRKVTAASSWDEAAVILNEKFNVKTFSSAVGWMINDKIVYEIDIFSSTGITTAAQKKLFRDKMYEQGYKRVRQICKGIDAKDTNWSMGYCYNVDLPKKTGVA